MVLISVVRTSLSVNYPSLLLHKLIVSSWNQTALCTYNKGVLGSMRLNLVGLKLVYLRG
jgi:hypothetical protein